MTTGSAWRQPCPDRDGTNCVYAGLGSCLSMSTWGGSYIICHVDVRLESGRTSFLPIESSANALARDYSD